MDHEFIWLPRDETVPERERYRVQSKKLMLTAVSNPRVFHLIDVLAPSDFYLFAYAKRSLAGLSFENADELLEAVQGVLECIEKDTFRAVFLEWMDRLRKGIATIGEHTD
jgi:hypothetical protein